MIWTTTQTKEGTFMAKHLVMDQTGHSEHVFNKNDIVDLKEAERRFAELVEKGYTPAVKQENGEHKVTRTFDPTAEQTLFIPQLKGG